MLLLIYLTIGFILFSYRKAEFIRKGRKAYFALYVLEFAWCMLLWPLAIASKQTVLPQQVEEDSDIKQVGIHMVRIQKSQDADTSKAKS